MKSKQLVNKKWGKGAAMSKLEFNRHLASHAPFPLSLLNTSIRRDLLAF